MCNLDFSFLLPRFNRGKDFFYFSTWNMFSEDVRTQVSDITWGDGKQYLMRDHRSTFEALNLDITVLFFLIQNHEIEKVRSDYGEIIQQICQCQNYELKILKKSFV